MGTSPKLAGKTPGIGYPTFEHTLRRTRIAKNHPMREILDKANVPFEPDVTAPEQTLVYEYPMIQGPVPPANEISLWEQAINLVTVQREWADNSVSNTLYFKPMWVLLKHERSAEKFNAVLQKYNFSEDETKKIEACVNFEGNQYKVIFSENYWSKKLEMKLYKYDPHHEEHIIEKVLAAIAPLIKACSLLPHSADGVYEQMPESGITKEEYEKRIAAIGKIDWSSFSGSDGMDEKFCTADGCELPNLKG